MNKEFEKQYRDYITEQMPDMWSRIEAGLKEKSTAKKVVAEVISEEIVTEASTEKQYKTQTGRKVKHGWTKNKTAAILIPAVAAAFLCLLVPAALWGSRGKSDGSTMNASPAAFEDKEVYDMADNMEAAGSGNSDAGMADNGGTPDFGMAEAAEIEEEAGANYADMENNAFVEKAGETAEFFGVRVRIEEIMEPADLQTDLKYDAMYLAEVLEIVETEEGQTTDFVLEGTKICFYVGEDTDKTEGEIPQIGEEYEVFLESNSEEKIYFAKKINFIP